MVQIKNVPYPIHSFKVPSRSEKGHWHRVELMNDGLLTCDCPSGFFRRITCRHREIVKKYLCQKEFINTNQTKDSKKETS